MKRLCLVALIAGISLNAHAVGRLADVSIIDRVSGNEIPTHFYRGEYWVAGAQAPVCGADSQFAG